MNEKTPQEIITEILGRWSVTDLREQKDADLRIGDEHFYKTDKEMKVISKGTHGVIRWWKIESDGKQYECRRFENFVFCSCLGFFFSKRMCKHLAITANVYCANCFVLPATKGKYCRDCDITINHFLKPSAKSEWTPIGSGKF